MAIKQTAGHDAHGDWAPEFAHLNDDILFGEVWNRNDKLSLKLRSIVTVSARKNGVTKSEMAEILTHIAFYAGWPNAWAAFNMAKEVYADEAAESEGHGGLFGLGEPNDAFAQYFIGQSYLKQVSPADGYLAIHNVTFEPGCRNNWHVHHAAKGGGQVLICVEGEGWYQEEGKPAQALKPGDIVEIPANVKHWHGAKADCWFSHLAFGFPGEDCSNEWLEPVTDEVYDAL